MPWCAGNSICLLRITWMPQSKHFTSTITAQYSSLFPFTVNKRQRWHGVISSWWGRRDPGWRSAGHRLGETQVETSLLEGRQGTRHLLNYFLYSFDTCATHFIHVQNINWLIKCENAGCMDGRVSRAQKLAVDHVSAVNDQSKRLIITDATDQNKFVSLPLSVPL